MQDNIGVINPYALAEVVLGRRVRWDRVADKPALLEATLGVPYELLFDPIHESPLYAGVKAQPQGELKRVTPDLDRLRTLAMEARVQPMTSPSERIETRTRPGVRRELRSYGMGRRRISFNADRFVTAYNHLMEPVSWAGGPQVGNNSSWAGPANSTWTDPGDFFDEGTEFFDPIQGALADCYFIAALSAVAWARPYVVAHRNRATGTAQADFVDMIQYHGSGGVAQVEVSERVPVNTAGNLIYARCGEPGEIWPAVYEKAFAKWKTGNTTDQPEIPKIAFGSPPGAVKDLTGMNFSWKANNNTSAYDLWQFVRAHSMTGKTFDPMVAWTYGSGSDSPANITYSDANLVANHAYTVLGWEYRDDKRYVVLRNPWGNTEASGEVLTGGWNSWDGSWMRNIPLGTGGVFALRDTVFKDYFAGISANS